MPTGHRSHLQCNMSQRYLHNYATPYLQSETTHLKCYDNSIITTHGQCTLQCQYKNKQHKLQFKVITGSQHPLLSVITCTELGLITVYSICNVSVNSANLIKQYSDVFEGLGCLGDEYHIEFRSWQRLLSDSHRSQNTHTHLYKTYL